MSGPVAPGGDDHELARLVALASLPDIGPATLAACRRDPGAAASWDAVVTGRAGEVDALAVAMGRGRSGAEPAELARAARAIDPDGLLAAHREDGQLVLAVGDERFPERLALDPHAPILLFARGDLAVVTGPTVAIVGTRNATRLGCEMAASLAVDLVVRGIGVVSGLALGIDGAAHRAVVAAHRAQAPAGTGRPIGVVAAGLDRPYPRRHRALHQEVAACGVVVGETPLGGAPMRWRFPARNRIIAALADAVVVVESRSAGGSMLTAAEALARDVPVLGVPGHPRAPAGAGPLDLIADGAAPVRDVEDVLVAIGAGGTRPLAAVSGTEGRRSGDGGPRRPQDRLARALVAELDAGAATLDGLVRASGRPLAEVAAAVSGLEANGTIVRRGAWFEASKGPAAGRAGIGKP